MLLWRVMTRKRGLLRRSRGGCLMLSHDRWGWRWNTTSRWRSLWSWLCCFSGWNNSAHCRRLCSRYCCSIDLTSLQDNRKRLRMMLVLRLFLRNTRLSSDQLVQDWIFERLDGDTDRTLGVCHRTVLFSHSRSGCSINVFYCRLSSSTKGCWLQVVLDSEDVEKSSCPTFERSSHCFLMKFAHKSRLTLWLSNLISSYSILDSWQDVSEVVCNISGKSNSTRLCSFGCSDVRHDVPECRVRSSNVFWSSLREDKIADAAQGIICKFLEWTWSIIEIEDKINQAKIRESYQLEMESRKKG